MQGPSLLPHPAMMALEGFWPPEGLGAGAALQWPRVAQWQPQALTTMLRCLRRMTLLLLS